MKALLVILAALSWLAAGIGMFWMAWRLVESGHAVWAALFALVGLGVLVNSTSVKVT